MALEDYAKKREFARTPEPGPHISPPADEGHKIFCIQRHAARRLHYDLRIEVGGTLKSWAIPQGPTLDPTIKRLAVHVEDHPLLYATFEGNIPKGNYGGGSMMLWDSGTYEQLGDGNPEAQLERGDFKFRLNGQKIKGEFALVRIKSSEANEWLLIKKKDDAARANWDIDHFPHSVASGRTQDEIAADLPARTLTRMPEGLTPMLASAGPPPRGPQWVYEIKWDGVRALCYLEGGSVKFVGRRGTVYDRQYPELDSLAQAVTATSAILDGEICALDDAGRPSFEKLQPRIMANGATAIARMARTNPVVFFAFDLLYASGQDLRELPLLERKERLRALLGASPHLPLLRAFRYRGRRTAGRGQGAGAGRHCRQTCPKPIRVRPHARLGQAQNPPGAGRGDRRAHGWRAGPLRLPGDGRVGWCSSALRGHRGQRLRRPVAEKNCRPAPPPTKRTSHRSKNRSGFRVRSSLPSPS